jgi:chromosome segregation ATPase
MKQYIGLVVLSAALITGCATGRSNQADIDALNARMSALQGQLAEKDSELNALQTQLADERMAREAAESALRSAPVVAAKKVQSDLK